MPLPIALHTIGQTPRPDLAPFLAAFVGSWDVHVTGALDGLSRTEIPPCQNGDFPLETRLKDGTRVEVGAAFLEPRIQRHIEDLEGQVALHLVLCAGPFPHLTSIERLVRPFEHACEVLTAQKTSSLAVVVPFAGQAEPAAAKWKQAGFRTTLYSMDQRPESLSIAEWLVQTSSKDTSDVFILDYVGYSRAILDEANLQATKPIVDLGYMAADFVRKLMENSDGSENGYNFL